MNPLSQVMGSELLRASATGVANAFNTLGTNFSGCDWLATNNSYRLDCVQKIKNDLSAGSINNGDLTQYIAASVPLHCIDGWKFLAQSLNSYCHGNPHQAAHFAYYAELRAAMSILASQGIGVFNNVHFTVDINGQCRRLTGNRGTHEFVWLALEQWAGTSSSGSSLLDVFLVSNATLKEWFSAPLGSLVASTVAREWLRDWGVDLRNAEADHSVRNLASYRPNAFSPWEVDASKCSEFLQGIWTLFEPSNSRFENLDSQLLRKLVRKVLVDANGSLNRARAEQQLATILNGLPIGDTERGRLRNFLLADVPEPLILKRAYENAAAHDPNVHERVMARAALLLRVSSGFSAKLIDDSAFSIADVQFWTEGLGRERAFWAAGGALDDLSELWTDVADALREEEAWLGHRGPGVIPMYDWHFGRERIIRPLSECDRVGLWGFQR